MTRDEATRAYAHHLIVRGCAAGDGSAMNDFGYITGLSYPDYAVVAWEGLPAGPLVPIEALELDGDAGLDRWLAAGNTND